MQRFGSFKGLQEIIIHNKAISRGFKRQYKQFFNFVSYLNMDANSPLVNSQFSLCFRWRFKYSNNLFQYQHQLQCSGNVSYLHYFNFWKIFWLNVLILHDWIANNKCRKNRPIFAKWTRKNRYSNKGCSKFKYRNSSVALRGTEIR